MGRNILSLTKLKKQNVKQRGADFHSCTIGLRDVVWQRNYFADIKWLTLTIEAIEKKLKKNIVYLPRTIID